MRLFLYKKLLSSISHQSIVGLNGSYLDTYAVSAPNNGSVMLKFTMSTFFLTVFKLNRFWMRLQPGFCLARERAA
jgi:hypothetical protein